MELQLVRTNYILKSWIGTIVKLLFVVYAVVLMSLTRGDWATLLAYENEISMASEITIVAVLMLSLLNIVLYVKIGKLSVTDNTLKFLSDDLNREIDLSTVKTMQFENVQKGIWKLRLDKETLDLKMNEDELGKLKQVLTQHNIHQKKDSFHEKLFGWFK